MMRLSEQHLPWLSLADASRLICARELSPVDYCRAMISRVERYDRTINAFLRFTPDLALEDALRAEKEIASGAVRGPLHGVPFALKDIIDYANLPTTAHSKILQDNVAQFDATVTQKLRAAGGVFMGKLATHEFAIGGPSFDLPWPPARNPWALDRFCGGSSSGAGAATAAGFVPVAIGTDTGGSVRNPAGMCGVVGMKPTYGLVSRRGVFPLAFSLDHVGPLTRTVRDNAMMLELLAGHDPRDPASSRWQSHGYTTLLDRDIRGIRVGLLRHFYTRDMVAEPEVAAGVEAAVSQLEQLGATVQEVQTAPLDEFAACNRIILTSEAFAIHEQWMRERAEDYGALARQRIMAGAFVRAADYVNATRIRRKLTAQFDALFSTVDVIVTANHMDLACRIDDPAAVERMYGRHARAPFNLTGSPALALPVGFSSSGLPLSIQVVGRPFSEALIYRVAHAYEQATGWGDRHPPLVVDAAN